MKTPQPRLIDTPKSTIRPVPARRPPPFPGGRNHLGQLHYGLPQPQAGKPVVLPADLEPR